ncbi:MAG: polyprenyl diphosphate synthase [Candidatus Methanomethylicus sp.]|nr:polyprenyl diphosphate synthase [Candidatus Methanomethylicus sp.]
MGLKPQALRAAVRDWFAKWIYKYYERNLFNQVRRGKVPYHVGLILDGNRRWAKEMGMDINSGHQYGFEKLKEVLKWCWELKIDTVTVYALSTENLSRSPEEVKELFRLMEKGFREILETKEISENEVKVRVIGRLDLLSDSLRTSILQAVDKTKNYKKSKFNVAIAYGGRAEIIDATKKIADSVVHGKLGIDEITESTFAKYLYTEGERDPDLIIRTSGEERLSGFLLWQSAYSEFYFVDVYWPEMRRIDFLRALRTYQQRQRRYGI